MSFAPGSLRRGAALLVCLLGAGVQAADDWLIARVNGVWTWESAGQEGRVQKRYLNQEVLRLNDSGIVDVVSLQPIQAGSSVRCSESARHDPRDPCSSAFLDCKPAPGGFFSVLLGILGDGARGAADARNAYRCSINDDAVLRAAREVGLIDNIPPRRAEKRADPVGGPRNPETTQ